MTHPGERALIRGANRMFPALWARGLSPEPDTAPPVMMQQASRAARLDDFGDDGFLPGLDRLCRAQAEEAGLTALGRVVVHGGLVRALTQRLLAVEWWKRHPDILDYPLPRPIIVLGGMRSGTTRLQRLLAADPRLQATRAFEAMTPAPPLSHRRGRPDPRRLQTRGLLFGLDRLNPAFRRIHPVRVNDADEELPMLELSICGAQIEAQRPVPAFRDWSERTPQDHAYRFLRPLIQLQGWLRGSDPARPWILKTPQYSQDLAALLGVFPDARIVAIHRDPAAMTASAASLAWNMMAPLSDTVTKGWCGAEWLHKTHFRERTAAAVRAAHPHVPAIDTHFAAMNADPIGEMRRIYGFLDLSFTEETEARMQRYLAAAARAGDHGRHRYTLGEFGLSEDDVAARFAADARRAGSCHQGAPGYR
ncbi:sulfotransferase family protein [Pacificimonas flava]|uniref:Sulfotransferase n=1 Tax=Pacificimonas flava TaxID=1234595 RepID=M2T966_9SPHN|nr:sulfotransferase [Pacificimonas flava]EMD83079.1 Sulfotransferase [Pacificimonas flava]MBB5280237.1 hypothetical protein [Pacificimonas flava]